MTLVDAVSVLVACLVPACGTQQAAPTWIDATTKGPPDASLPQGLHCDQPYSPGKNKIFLAFQGETFVPGPEDATRDQSELVGAPETLAPFRAGAADRDAEIAAITDDLRMIYGGVDVEITTARPTSGTYAMIVFGGDAAQLGQPTGTPAVTKYDCGNVNPSSVVVVFEYADETEITYANLAARYLGVSLGIPFDAVYGHCLCVIAAGCYNPSPMRCAIGGIVPLIPAEYSQCGTLPLSADETGEFAAQLGCRP